MPHSRSSQKIQGDFFLITQVAVLGFYMFCAVNACDDDAEVLRILDGLDYLAVLPHQLFTITTLWTCAGLVYWCYMDFGCVPRSPLVLNRVAHPPHARAASPSRWSWRSCWA